MAKVKERGQALKMRKGGASIGEIAHKLKVSKSTVSDWCKDIQLTNKQIDDIAERSRHHATAALLRSAESRRQKRKIDILSAQEKARHDTLPISGRDIRMIGLGLYWGEGYKTGSQEFGFSNSDSRMIKFYLKWLEKMFGVMKEDLTLRVSVNVIHKQRMKAITEYWSKVTGVPKRQFTKPSLIRASSKKVYPNPEKHFGTLRIKVRKGTQFRREVLAAIDLLSRSTH